MLVGRRFFLLCSSASAFAAFEENSFLILLIYLYIFSRFDRNRSVLRDIHTRNPKTNDIRPNSRYRNEETRKKHQIQVVFMMLISGSQSHGPFLRAFLLVMNPLYMFCVFPFKEQTDRGMMFLWHQTKETLVRRMSTDFVFWVFLALSVLLCVSFMSLIDRFTLYVVMLCLRHSAFSGFMLISKTHWKTTRGTSLCGINCGIYFALFFDCLEFSESGLR